tara:strand:+ start:9173 stop:9319 length:147 start_codon:yes stop_codon:yes gene_type:complete
MDSLSELDLGSTLLSLAIAGGFIAFGFLILRTLFMGIRYLFDKIRGSD